MVQRVGFELVKSGYETSEPGYESSGCERSIGTKRLGTETCQFGIKQVDKVKFPT